jgi:F-type H+-transporting ATPase subunit delta
LKSASQQYATALADVAFEQSAVDAVMKQLNDFYALYRSSAELRNFLSSPAVTRQAKHGVIERLVGRTRASKTVLNFLFVVVDHQRTAILPEIVAAVQEVVGKRQGIVEAQVSSAIELTSAQKTELAFTLERITGRRVEARFSLEPSLLGGAVVRVGDTIYDGSLRTQLNELRSRLAAE